MKTKIIIFLFLCISNFSFTQTKLVFSDDYSTNDKNWYSPDKPTYSASVTEGVYKIMLEMESGNWKLSKSTFIDYDKDYIIEAMMRQTSGVNHSFGIVWGGKDSDNTYAFSICKGQQYKVYGWRAEELFTLKDWTSSDAIKEMGEFNKLQIKKQGAKLHFYVNDTLLYSCDDQKMMGYVQGFVVTNTMRIEIDYFKIYQDVEINLISNPINGYIKENLGSDINSAYSEVWPAISPDGKTLFVGRYHPTNEHGFEDCDIWYSQLQNDKWDVIQRLGKPLNTKGGNNVISVSPDGNSLFLLNTYNSDGSVSSGISKTLRTADGWGFPTNYTIKEYKNKNRYVTYFLSSDNKTLLMGIESDDSNGDTDIYVSFLTEDGFTKPKNLGTTINSIAADFSPFMASDNTTLYYASEGKMGYGSADIFVSRRLDDSWTNWSVPQNLGPEINSDDWDAYFTIPASGENAYMVSSKNSLGKSDIFKIKLPEAAKPNPVVLIYGKVLHAKTKEPLSATITYADLKDNKELGTAISNPVDGSYKIVLPYGRIYSFMAEKENFYSISENIDVTNITKYEEIERNLYLNPIEVGEVIRLNNIFFDVNKSELKKESYAELDRLIELMNKYPAMKIGIQGHTDSDGVDEYNMQLSKSRALSVMNYLLSKNIPADRLSSMGFGETKPVLPNTSIENKAINRRVEFTIISK